MISIIICSRDKSISEELSTNISETINHDYELIVIDNSKNKYSIFEAYNSGIKKSKGLYWCFIHDDILGGAFDIKNNFPKFLVWHDFWINDKIDF